MSRMLSLKWVNLNLEWNVQINIVIYVSEAMTKPGDFRW